MHWIRRICILYFLGTCELGGSFFIKAGFLLLVLRQSICTGRTWTMIREVELMYMINLFTKNHGYREHQSISYPFGHLAFCRAGNLRTFWWKPKDLIFSNNKEWLTVFKALKRSIFISCCYNLFRVQVYYNYRIIMGFFYYDYRIILLPSFNVPSFWNSYLLYFFVQTMR